MKRDRAVVRIPPRPASRQGPRGRAHTTTAGGPFIPPHPCTFNSPFSSLSFSSLIHQSICRPSSLSGMSPKTRLRPRRLPPTKRRRPERPGEQANRIPPRKSERPRDRTSSSPGNCFKLFHFARVRPLLGQGVERRRSKRKCVNSPSPFLQAGVGPHKGFPPVLYTSPDKITSF